MLLDFEKICKTYGDRSILTDVTFSLREGDRVGIVGANGCGKSTLLRIAAGAEEPDSGRRSTDPGVRVSWLPQDPSFSADMTAQEQVLAMLPADAREAEAYEVREMLTRLDITDFSKKMAEFSGGQRKRIALAACLLQPADLYILDEPTNHLDAAMIEWLEEKLSGFRGALLFVTHDRYFLENLATRVMEVSFGSVYFYEGSYSAWLDGRARREEQQAATERKRQARLRRELAWVLQGPPARSTKSRERLARYEALRAQQPPEYRQELGPIASLPSRLGRMTVALESVSKDFGGRRIIDRCSLRLLRDDRVGIMGANGAGKTTLLNLIAGRLTPDEGTVSVGDTVRFGYFSQHAAELDPRMTALEYVRSFGDRIETRDGPLTASKLMEQFLFDGPTQHRLIGRLSGGEKRRLFLLGILASAPNILLLDEPTNDLDIPTLQVLEDYLEVFPGAIVSVSHDRYFLDRICRRTFAVEPGGAVREYTGGYTQWREQQTAVPEKPAAAPDPVPQPRSSGKPARLKFSFNEQREYASIDADIAALEAAISENSALQAANASDYQKLQTLMAEQTELEARLEAKTERWIYLTDLAERIAAQS